MDLNPRIITTDKYTSTIKTIKNETKSKKLYLSTKHQSSRYMNNIIEQDHHNIK
ncbi:MAG: DDE-type integrase/transposase/recombinase [Clostridiales bacterium]|nr:DDE-type integrase/transposase/recombinase [Clostridiales bacterium]